MSTAAAYVAHTPDDTGFIAYSPAEHAVWRRLMERQMTHVRGRACDEFITGLERLRLPVDRIPQCEEISCTLRALTGWQIVPVPALIELPVFFELLSERRFPAASFIRCMQDLEYVTEPDIFHEIFGHTPMLTDTRFAAFSEAFGRAGAAADPSLHPLLARLYWFTVEFGLIATPQGLRSYGAGIGSSISETRFALESTLPQRLPFDAMAVMRTPYRIDALQKVYFVIESFDALFELASRDLITLAATVQSALQTERDGDRTWPPHAC